MELGTIGSRNCSEKENKLLDGYNGGGDSLEELSSSDSAILSLKGGSGKRSRVICGDDGDGGADNCNNGVIFLTTVNSTNSNVTSTSTSLSSPPSSSIKSGRKRRKRKDKRKDGGMSRCSGRVTRTRMDRLWTHLGLIFYVSFLAFARLSFSQPAGSTKETLLSAASSSSVETAGSDLNRVSSAK